jgi:hypothetical protein
VLKVNRYRYFFLIAIVAVLGISVFYINSAQSESRLPQFMIEKQSGDENEMKQVKVLADYGVGRTSDRVDVTTTGTTYFSNGSFLNRVKNMNGYTPEKIKQLREKYHGFMRGKGDYLSFFENGEAVAYVTVPFDPRRNKQQDLQFHVSLLNKKNKDQSTYKIGIPNQVRYSTIYVEDVQMINQQLIVITNNNIRNKKNVDSYSAEFHTYTIDLSKKKTIDDKMIIKSNDSGGPVRIDVSKENEVEEIQSNPYVVFNEVTTKETPLEDGSISSEKMNQKIVIYNLENEKKEEFKDIEKVLKTEHARLHSYNQSYLYFTENKPDGVRVMAYNFRRHALEEEFLIPLRMDSHKGEGMSSEDQSIENGPAITISGHKIYMVTPYDGDSQIVISDLRTGKILYQAIVKPEKNDKNKGYKFNTNGLEVSA